MDMGELVFLIERTSNPALREAVNEHLRPIALRLRESRQSRTETRFNAGLLWIAFARILVHLFVPDKPIDPAALQSRTLQFWQREESVLRNQIAMHLDLESRVTGNTTNGSVRFLEGLLQDEIGRAHV